MEENQEKLEEVKEKPKVENKEIKISQSTLAVCMALFAMFLFVLCRVLIIFGVGSGTFYGIMSIIMYALPLTGLIWSYLRNKKPSFEFWLNVIMFALVVWKF